MTAIGTIAAATTAELTAAGLDFEDVCRVVRTALDEDLRLGPDVTTDATVPAEARTVAAITPRTDGVAAGIPLALSVFDLILGSGYEIVDRQYDGDRLVAGAPAIVVSGPTRGLLTAERTALNLLTHASGIATATARWAAELVGTGCVVRDTRKTLPGLRSVQKYAVRCGGGTNHRYGLGDAILIKDNHVAAAGSVSAAVHTVRRHAADLPCEVEVDDLDQFDEALALGVDEILLDNFTVAQCAHAVRRRDLHAASTRLEASGGLRLDLARAYAATGVDYLAIGALTHSATAVDLGMDRA